MIVKLSHLDGRCFAVTEFTRLGGQWAWIQDCCAEEFECHSDDISGLEDNFIALNGNPVARIDLFPQWKEK